MDCFAKTIEEWKHVSICRCCLKDTCFKDISNEYYYSGQKEIYKDMLKDTFNIQFSDQNLSSSNNQLICDNCIVKLRDATAFKTMVVHNEESFVKYFASIYGAEEENKIIASQLKVEAVKIESSPVNDMGFDIKCDVDGDDSFDDDEILANIKLELGRSEEIVIFENTKEQRKNPVKRTKLKKCKIKQAIHTNQKDWTKIAERRGHGPILRENSLKLLEHSTICVFQWNKSWYRCFCCKEPFPEMDLLKEHTKNNHTLEDIEKKIILQQNRLVKVEISYIHCKLCSSEIEDLNQLRNHLMNDHNINFTLNEDLLVPFKINKDLKCQICKEKFSVFRLLNIHVNKHFRKQVCHICGAGFSNLVFLNLHKTRSHRPFSCKTCNLTFPNKSDKKAHDMNNHGVKYERKLRFPCPYCDQRFFQENFRVQHLVEKHGMSKPEFKCTVCEKAFITRSLCNNHMKNVHLKEKNVECDICHNFFYTKSDVSRHRVTHTGEKKFICTVCNNPFATKDSLRRHMKRTHAVH